LTEVRDRCGCHSSRCEVAISASAGAASRQARASAPPAASLTCQRNAARASRTRWRKATSGLVRIAVRGGAAGRTADGKLEELVIYPPGRFEPRWYCWSP
jgi:hypothetical protein